MKNSVPSVYEFLHDKIINLEYTPGQELNIKSIAEELGVSRSPIRDALLRLELDKLVDIFPQKGTRVSFLEKNIIKQERLMRFTLEIGILKLFLQKMSDENERKICCTKLRAIIMQQKAAMLSGDKKEFLHQDDNFHHFFYEATDNQWIWDVMKSHTGNDFRIRLLSFYSEIVIGNAKNEHSLIVDAIEKGDFAHALELTEDHLQKVSEVVGSLYSDYSDYFSA